MNKVFEKSKFDLFNNIFDNRIYDEDSNLPEEFGFCICFPSQTLAWSVFVNRAIQEGSQAQYI